MPRVELAALGATRKMLGFSRRSVDAPEGTVADLLRSLKTIGGSTLYEIMTYQDRLRGNFAVVVDGRGLNSEQLDTKLAGGEQIVTLAILRHLHGG
jgi:hypothetical protein